MLNVNAYKMYCEHVSKSDVRFQFQALPHRPSGMALEYSFNQASGL